MVASGGAVPRPTSRHVAAGVRLILCLLFCWVANGPASAQPRYPLMPNVVGMPLAKAEAVLARQKLRPSQVTPVRSGTAANVVVRQYPDAQQPVDKPIVLTVSQGEMATVQVPDLRGQTPNQAVQTLKAAGLVLGQQNQAVSNQEPAGRIIMTRPGAGASVQQGSTISYEIALQQQAPPPRILMPNVVGLPLNQAEAVLYRLQLRPSAINSAPSSDPANVVVGQQPYPQRPVNQPIILTVSQGIVVTTVQVPDLRGQTPGQAIQTLKTAVLVLGRESQAVSNAQPPGRIMATNPPPGATVTRGSAVSYQVAQPAPAPLMPDVTGVPLATAKAALAQQRLKAPAVKPAPSSQPANWVIGQQPAAQQPVNGSSSIVLTVSTGPQQLRVPNLLGKLPGQAARMLQGVGLVLGRQSVALSNALPAGRIIATTPAPGQPVKPGTAVNYEIAQPPVIVVPPAPPVAPPAPPVAPPTPPAVPPVPPDNPSSTAPASGAEPTQSSASSAASSAASSTAESAASAGPAPPLALSESGQPNHPDQTRQTGQTGQTGLVGWAETNPGWVAALAVALVAGAGVIGWLMHPPPPPPVPVIVTASMLAVPASTLGDTQPSAEPVVSVAWRTGPPETRLQTQIETRPESPGLEEPSP